jgi:hypothetical protein
LIFIGKELTLDWKDRRGDDYGWPSTVEVVRVIHGDSLEPGTKICVGGDAVAPVSNYHRRATPQHRIYFVSPIAAAKGRKPYYQVYTHLPVDQEATVREALGRRNEYPVVEREEGGRKIKCREILFRGSNAEAIDLLEHNGLFSNGLFSLLAGTLMHRRKSARPEVVTAIEKSMFRMETRHATGFLGLQRLISLLGDMENEDGGGGIARLVEKYFVRLEQGSLKPPWPTPADWRDVRREPTRTTPSCGCSRSLATNTAGSSTATACWCCVQRSRARGRERSNWRSTDSGSRTSVSWGRPWRG